MSAVCIVTRAENAAGARIERRDALRELAYGALLVEYLAAAQKPLTEISTPDGHQPRARLIDVLSDQLAGRDSDQRWVELTGVLVQSEAGREWLRARAMEHAGWHADEAAYGGAA